MDRSIPWDTSVWSTPPPRSFFLGEYSHFLKKFDPLYQGLPPPQDILLDHYLIDRARRGSPVTAPELEAAARYFDSIGGYGPTVADNLRIRVLGPNHPLLTEFLNNLALLYQAQGKYAEAEPLIKRALVNVEKAWGPNHPLASNLFASSHLPVFL